MRTGVVPVALFLFAAGCAPSSEITSADELIIAMHDRYADTWYRSVAFSQDVTFYDSTGAVTRTEVWHEVIRPPAELRLDFEPLDQQRAAIYRNDSLFQIQGGAIASSRPQMHSLLVIAFDVYRQPPNTTLRRLMMAGYDLTRFHRGEFEGRPVYVVGADAGDTTSMQFWVDTERLVFVRSIASGGSDGSQTSGVTFRDYEQLAGGWIAPTVEFMTNGRVGFRQTYRDIAINVDLSEGVFDPYEWTEPTWRSAAR